MSSTAEQTASQLVVLAPIAGRAVGLEAVPDAIFAQALVGPGAAIDPPRAVVDAVAPVSGTLIKVFPHAYVVQNEDGVGVLVHLGINTVELDGEGFTLRAEQGTQVTAGDAVVTFDVAAVEGTGRNPIVPVIALEQAPESVAFWDSLADGSSVTAGEPFLTVEI